MGICLQKHTASLAMSCIYTDAHPSLSYEDELLFTRPEFLENYVWLTDFGTLYITNSQPVTGVFQRKDTVDESCLQFWKSVPIPVCVH